MMPRPKPTHVLRIELNNTERPPAIDTPCRPSSSLLLSSWERDAISEFDALACVFAVLFRHELKAEHLHVALAIDKDRIRANKRPDILPGNLGGEG